MTSYDDKASKTAKVTDKKITIHYGSGSLSGHYIFDDVRIGFGKNAA